MKYHRKSIRLKGYDYSKEGLYFITISTYKNQYLFGEIIDGEMVLNDAGRMVEDSYFKLEERFDNMICCEYVIMPNHIHFIIEIRRKCKGLGKYEGEHKVRPYNIGNVGANLVFALDSNGFALDSNRNPCGTKPNTISRIIQGFKSLTTVEYIHNVKNNNWSPFEKRIWHRNYYESIIKNEDEYKRVSKYIEDNPQKWKDERLVNPMDFIRDKF